MTSHRTIVWHRIVVSRGYACTAAAALAVLVASVAVGSGESPHGARVALLEESPPTVREIVSEYAAREFGSNGSSTEPARYVAGEVDLDGSPPLEIVARFEGEWCAGNVGCLMVVFSRTAEGYWRPVLNARGDDLYAQAGRTRGWRDLEVAGGRGVGSYRWEGERYAFYEAPMGRVEVVRYHEARDPNDIAHVRRLTGSLLDEVLERSGTPVTVEVAHRDLDGDGMPDLLVVLRHPSLCTDDRCEQMIVLGSSDGTDRVVFHQRACGPLRLLESRTDGVTDLLVRCDEEPTRRDRWVWAGDGYAPTK